MNSLKKLILIEGFNTEMNYFKGFWKGLGSACFLYNTPKYKMITEEDVIKMTEDDWKAVGDDLRESIKNCKKEFGYDKK